MNGEQKAWTIVAECAAAVLIMLILCTTFYHASYNVSRFERDKAAFKAGLCQEQNTGGSLYGAENQFHWVRCK